MVAQIYPLSELNAVKACWEFEVWFHAFRTTALVEVSGEFFDSVRFILSTHFIERWLVTKTIAAREGNRSTGRCLSLEKHGVVIP